MTTNKTTGPRLGKDRYVAIGHNPAHLKIKWMFVDGSQPEDHHVLAAIQYQAALTALFEDQAVEVGQDSNLPIYTLLSQKLFTPATYKSIVERLGGIEKAHVLPIIIRSFIINQLRHQGTELLIEHHNIFFVQRDSGRGFDVVCLYMYESEWWMSVGHNGLTELCQPGTRIYSPAVIDT